MPELLAQDLFEVYERTSSLWKDMRGGRIFITGGTGFAGTWLLESFVYANDRMKLDAEVVVLTRDPLAFRCKAPHLAKNPSLRLHQGDVRNFLFPTGRFTHVIHAANERDPWLYAEHPMRMLDIMLSGTRRVLDFTLQSGNPKFLLASSSAIYGSPPAGWVYLSEDDSARPDAHDPSSVFGEGKRLSETLCLTYGQHYGIQVKIGRLFPFLGPHLPLKAHCTVERYLQEGLQGGPIRVNGNIAEAHSYLYAADLAVWLWTILVRGECGRAYNVGSEQVVTSIELARQIGQAFTPPVGVSVPTLDLPACPLAGCLPNTRLAQDRLQLKQEIRLEEAIHRTVMWMNQANIP